MRQQPCNEQDGSLAPGGQVDRMLAKGVSPRRVVYRTARKHGMPPKHLSALIAQAEQLEGGLPR